MAQMVKRLLTMRETQVRSLGWEDPLEKEMATHSGTLAWIIPWMEEHCRLQSMGSQELDMTEQLHFHFLFFSLSLSSPLATWEAFTVLAAAAAAKSLHSCPTLCDPRDGSPPGSPVPGILQARTLEWVAISFSNA